MLRAPIPESTHVKSMASLRSFVSTAGMLRSAAVVLGVVSVCMSTHAETARRHHQLPSDLAARVRARLSPQLRYQFPTSIASTRHSCNRCSTHVLPGLLGAGLGWVAGSDAWHNCTRPQRTAPKAAAKERTVSSTPTKATCGPSLSYTKCKALLCARLAHAKCKVRMAVEAKARRRAKTLAKRRPKSRAPRREKASGSAKGRPAHEQQVFCFCCFFLAKVVVSLTRLFCPRCATGAVAGAGVSTGAIFYQATETPQW